jgi:hypothetical protein
MKRVRKTLIGEEISDRSKSKQTDYKDAKQKFYFIIRNEVHFIS